MGRFEGNSGGYGNRSMQPRENHKATCDACKNDCTVPFKPLPGRPVYCKDCYSKNKKN